MAGQLSSIFENGQYSDDIPKLNRSKFHYLFTYGTLKKGYRNHGLIADQPLIGCGYTTARNFIMYNERAAAFPIAMFTSDHTTGHRIYGEVYRVEVEDIRTLDQLESNDVLYKRYKLEIQSYQANGHMQKVKAWTYVGRRAWWNTRLPRLDVISPTTEGELKYYKWN
jgi:gamma-glutamylaminecyclotransferase